MNLRIGTDAKGQAFELPREAVTQTFAILAIRGAGKTINQKPGALEGPGSLSDPLNPPQQA